MVPKVVVGVLALQGDFSKHIDALHALGVTAKEVRKPEDLRGCDGLIIPGGESTAIFRQLKFMNFDSALLEFVKQKPVFGTCAGLILLSNEIIGDAMRPLGILDIQVERNAFGRQAESFSTEVDCKINSKRKTLPAFFIRTPRIRGYGREVKILAEFEGEPVLVQQGHHLGATFHPELTEDATIHAYFLQEVEKVKNQ